MRRTGFKRKDRQSTVSEGSKPKKRKKSDLTKAKEKLWKLTREEVFKTYGRDCYTCHQKNLQGSNCQGGHVPWPKSILSTECQYDIRFIRPQCYDCNINKGGMGALALERMQKENINITILWEINQKTRGQKYGIHWLNAKIAEYEISKS